MTKQLKVFGAVEITSGKVFHNSLPLVNLNLHAARKTPVGLSLSSLLSSSVAYVGRSAQVRSRALVQSSEDSVTDEGSSELIVVDGVTEEAKISDENSGVNGKIAKQEKYKKLKAETIQKAKELLRKGVICKMKVEAANSGGLVVRFNVLLGFVPYSQLDQSRFTKGGKKKDPVDVGAAMVGQQVSLLITKLEDDGRLILSEKEAKFQDSIKKVQQGQVYSGTVSLVTDFGAFVEIKLLDGTSSITGLVHLSELSWDLVRSVKDFVSVGDSVKVKVIQVDREKKRVGLSMKQLQSDPLLETLDVLLPAEPQKSEEGGSTTEDSVLLTAPLPGLDEFCKELRAEPRISSVSLGRQAVEKRVVSQDLELWLSNAPSEKGKYVLLARAGRQVQEVNVQTNFSREEMKEAIQRVIGRVP